MSICVRAEFIDRYINQLAAVFHFVGEDKPRITRARRVIKSATDLRFEISFLSLCLSDSFVYEMSTLILFDSKMFSFSSFVFL